MNREYPARGIGDLIYRLIAVVNPFFLTEGFFGKLTISLKFHISSINGAKPTTDKFKTKLY